MAKLMQNAQLVTIFSVLSQIFAFIRTAIMAALFGASSLVDAYTLAYVVPVACANIIGGWLQVGFVGRYLECCRDSNPKAAMAFRGAIGLLVLALSSGGSIIMLLGSNFIIEQLEPATAPETRMQIQTALSIAAWALPLMTMSEYLGMVLNCHNLFFAAAAGPIVNAAVSVVTLWFWPQHDLLALLWTLTIGWLAQLAVMVGSHLYNRTSFTVWCKGMGKEITATLKLAVPILPAVFFSNFTAVLIQAFCSRFGEGAVAIYGYATKLQGALSQVIIVGISTVLLPHFAEMLAEKNQAQIDRTLKSVFRATLLVSLLVIAGICTLGETTVYEILGRGKFDRQLSHTVTTAWLLLSLSLFPNAISIFLGKFFSARRQPLVLSLSSLISLIATGAICYSSKLISSFDGIMLAPLAAQVAVMVYFISRYRHDLGQMRFLEKTRHTVMLCLTTITPPLLIDQLLSHWLLSEHNFITFIIRSILFLLSFAFCAKLNGIIVWIIGKEKAPPPKPNIAFAISSLGPGGAERVISELANNFANLNYDVSLLTFSNDKPDYYPLSPIIKREHAPIFWDTHNPIEKIYAFFRRLLVIRSKLKQASPEVVISFIDMTNVLVLLSLIGTGIKTIVCERTDPRHHSIGKAWSWLRKLSYPLADSVVVQTKSVADWLKQQTLIENLAIIPNWVRPLTAPTPTRPNIMPTQKNIVAMGRFTWEKGFDQLIRAYARSNLAASGWKLIILGDGPLRLALNEQINAANLSTSILLPGLQNNPQEWLTNADIFVLSSHYEGFPNALLEAMQCGVASIAYNCQSGPADIIENGKNGLLITAGDENALSQALIELAQDRDLRKQLGTNARQVNQRFSQEVIITQWIALINSAVGKKTQQEQVTCD